MGCHGRRRGFESRRPRHSFHCTVRQNSLRPQGHKRYVPCSFCALRQTCGSRMRLFRFRHPRRVAVLCQTTNERWPFFVGRGKQFILVLAMVTVLSALNATVLLSCRILFGMGRDGWLPHWLSSVNSGGTPSAALLVVSLPSIVLILSGGASCTRPSEARSIFPSSPRMHSWLNTRCVDYDRQAPAAGSAAIDRRT